MAAATVAKVAARTPVPATPAKVVQAVKPAVEASAAVVSKTVETLEKVVAKSAEMSAEIVKGVVGTAARSVPATPVTLTAMAPKPPAFASITAGTMLTQTLAMARTFGALQARMLDHACAELKATLGEVETLARTDSAADAVALQAKAVRRGYEAYAAHLTDLAKIAGASLPKR